MIFLQVLRPLNCLMASLAILIGVFLGGFFQIDFIIYALLAGFLVCGAGMVINDYYDIEIDKINKPEKYRRMKKYPKNLWLIYSMILFISGIIISSLVNTLVFSIAVINSILLIVYAAKLKKTTLIGNLIISYLVASLFVFGAAVSGNVSIALFLALLAFFSNTGREIVKDIEDVIGDRKAGAMTLAVSNKKTAVVLAVIFVLSAVVISPLPYVLGLLSINYLYVVLVTDIIFAYSCFLIFVSPKKSQKFMKIAMVFGLISFLVGIYV